MAIDITSNTNTPVIDLSNDANFAQGFPHESFNWLRDNAPLFWHEPTDVTPDGEGFWVVSRYADVIAIQRDSARFSSDKAGERTGGGTGIKDERGAGMTLNMTDDPLHKRYRSLVNKGFTPKAINELEDDLAALLNRLLDDVADQDSFDFVSAVARELPLQTICSVLGVPQEDRRQLVEWVDLGISADSPSIIDRTYMLKIREYAKHIVEEKRRNPANDILSTIVHAEFEEDGSKLSDPELMAFFTLLFPAGAETTRGALGGAVKAFIDFPEQFQLLKKDPSLMRSAVEEVIRWTTPSIYKRRTATEDVNMHGQTIKLGDKLTFWEMSANRDERFFDRPFEFDINRWPNKHVGLGAGVHFCLGASLARMEINVTLKGLCERFDGFELAGEPDWMPNNRLLGLRKMEIRTLNN
ncbi:MAG: cytochrome P450 [Pseudomonadales bacterium]|nr:cytochrome P450 [Pseudomonadales bacterium]